MHIAHPHRLITDSEGVDFARRRQGGFACRKRRGRERWGVVRLLPDGRLDKSLSGDGTLVYDTPVQVKVWDVAVQGNGKILVAGGWGSYPTTDTLVQRFTESGTPDAFGPGGSSRRIINLGGNDEATSIALQPGGEVLVGSTSHTGQDRLIRLFAGGDQDTGFGSGGVLSLTYNLETVALAPDGKIVLGGAGSLAGTNDAFAVERRNADGTPDSTFAGGSVALSGVVPGEPAGGIAFAVAPDGKIVSAGETGTYPGTRGVLIRFKGQPDPEPAPAPAPGVARPADALALSGLRLTNRRFAVGRARTARIGPAQAAAHRKRGTAFVFRLNRSAVVSIRIKRVATTRTGRRLRNVALLKRTARTGGNRVRFSGRVGRRALRPGRYSATLTAVNAEDKRSKPATVAFRILRS